MAKDPEDLRKAINACTRKHNSYVEEYSKSTTAEDRKAEIRQIWQDNEKVKTGLRNQLNDLLIDEKTERRHIEG
jgi:hypothetical protein